MSTPAEIAQAPHSPLLPMAPAATRLSAWGVIRAHGEEAAKFLHGQLTQDIEHLQPGQARLAGYCSAKGRLLASFVVWRPAADEVLLACSADVLPATLKRLQMFVLRARCRLEDASAALPLWGLAGAQAGPPGPAWATVPGFIRLPDALVAGTPVPRWLQAGGNAPALPELDLAAWLALEACSGVARIVAATAEQFVPQMVNLELAGGVNFQKGCYPGQEVVARSQYRGTVKRRAQLLHGPLPLHPGQEVFHSADPAQPAGMVVLAGTLPPALSAGLPAPQVALVELKLAALDGGSLHAGAPEGPLLSLGALPYAIPAEAA
jgi:folate-binding protein YgfZ